MKKALPRFVAFTAILAAVLLLPVVAHTEPLRSLPTLDAAPDDPYMRLINQARELMGHNRNETLKILDKAIEMRPKDCLAYCWKTNTFILMNRWTDALSEVRGAESLGLRDCELLRYTAMVQDHLGLFSQNQTVFQKAKKVCQNALWFKLFGGRMLCATGNYQASIEPLSTFMQQYPNFNGTSGPLTLSEASSGHYEAALQTMDSQSRPSRASLRTSPAKTMDNTSLYLSVSKNLDRRIHQEGLTTRNLFARAVCRYEQGKYSLCLQDAQALVKGKTELPVMWVLLARAQAALKHFDQARSAVEKAIALAPQSELGYSALCELNFSNGSYQHTVDDLQARLKTDPKNAALHAVLGRLYAELSMPDESIAQLKSALDANPSRSDIHLTLAQMFEAKKDFGAAITEYSKAISLSRKTTFEALKGRAACYLEMHRYDSALADLNRLLAQFQTATLFQARAACLEQLGKKPQSREDRVKAQALQDYREYERFGQASY